MAKSGGSAGVQRKLRGIDVGMVTHENGVYTIPVSGRGTHTLNARLALGRAGLHVVNEKPINEHRFGGWRVLTARRG